MTAASLLVLGWPSAPNLLMRSDLSQCMMPGCAAPSDCSTIWSTFEIVRDQISCLVFLYTSFLYGLHDLEYHTELCRRRHIYYLRPQWINQCWKKICVSSSTPWELLAPIISITITILFASLLTEPTHWLVSSHTLCQSASQLALVQSHGLSVMGFACKQTWF